MSSEIQEILAKVATSLAEFDAVCMATALHTIASLRVSALEYEGLNNRAEVKQLLEAVSE